MKKERRLQNLKIALDFACLRKNFSVMEESLGKLDPSESMEHY